MRRIAAGTALIAALAAGTPARADIAQLPDAFWPMYQYTADRNAVFDAPSWNLNWRVDVGRDCASTAAQCFSTRTYSPGQINGSLSIVGTTLFVESFDRKFYAIDAMTGKQLWSQTLDNIAMNTPLVANGIVVVGGGGPATFIPQPDGSTVLGRAEGDHIFAFRANDGSPMWQFKTRGQNMPTGLVTSDETPSFIFTNGDEHAYRLDLNTGASIWQIPTHGGGIMSSIAQENGIVYASTGWGLSGPPIHAAYVAKDAKMLANAASIFAMRSSDGSVLWRAPYGRGLGPVTLGGSIVFVESNRWHSFEDTARKVSEVDALDAGTGKLLWQFVSEPGLGVSKATNLDAIAGTYVDGVLYQSVPYPKTFDAFDARTGRILWSVPTHGPVKMGAVVKDGIAYFGDVDGYMYVVETKSGAVAQTIAFPQSFSCSAPLIVGSTLFVANGATLYALPLEDLRSGHVPFGVKQ